MKEEKTEAIVIKGVMSPNICGIIVPITSFPEGSRVRVIIQEIEEFDYTKSPPDDRVYIYEQGNNKVPLKVKFDICTCTEHNVPSHRYYEPGDHVHVCPACGYKTKFTVMTIF